MLKLSKTQEKMVKQNNVGVSVIKGERHSGKTSIATSRMLYLLDHICKAGERVLYVCANESDKKSVCLEVKQYHHLENVSLFDGEPRGEAVIKDIDALIEAAADKADVHLYLEICEEVPKELILALLPKVRRCYPKVRWLREEHLGFISHELEWVNSCGYDTLEKYVAARRKGAAIKLAKKGNGRKAIWTLKEWANEELRKNGQMTKSQMQLDTLGYLREDTLREHYKHIIIDDAEKLTKVQLECIKALKAEGEGEVLFLMDKNKSDVPFAWLGQGENFKTIGYHMTGRVKHLVNRKAAHGRKVDKEVALTPLELFIKEQSNLSSVKDHADQKVAQKAAKESVKQEEKVQSKLPWYVETYRYVNKVTGVETIFQRDSSAGEVYIDEVRQEDIDEIPVYTDIAAGMPIELVDEVSGQFEMPSELLHHKKDTYILHVQGDSMIGADISNGDYVVIESGNVNNHEIAAIYYNGATTLKRIEQEKDRILLVSENPKYDPIVIEDGDFRVMGKLVGVIKAL